MSSSAPVIASKPVANTITSSSYSVLAVLIPRAVIAGDRVAANVDERDVVAVVGLVVVDVDADALGPDRMCRRAQSLGGRGVVDDLADLRAHEVGGRLVGLGVDVDVVERQQDAGDPALRPAALEHGFALLRGDLQRRALRHRIRMRARDAAQRLPGQPAPLSVRGLDGALNFRSSGALCAGMLKFGRALEDMEVLRLLGELRDQLDASGAGADDADALAGEARRRPAASARCGTSRPRTPRGRRRSAG